MRSEVVMSVNVLWRKKSQARSAKGRCKKIMESPNLTASFTTH